MWGALKGVAQRLGDCGQEAGMTLVELMVTALVSLVVLSAVLGLLVTSLHVQKNSSSRVVATQMGADMLQRITREIRQASSATIYTSTAETTQPTTCSISGVTVCGGVLDLQTPVPSSGGTSTTMHVVYDCTSGTCTRSQGPVGGTLGTAQPVIDQHITISNVNSVFGASTSSGPSFVSVTLDQALGSPFTHPVEFQDGVALRDSSSTS
jgi:type II secretory pathway pseudopilin PulG